MFIRVLTDTLPENGYREILYYYNSNKPDNWKNLRQAGVYEGGFEVSKNESEIEELQKRYRYLDPNEKVRQVRWSNGRLLGLGHLPLLEEETLLLYQALKHVLGENLVELNQ